MIAVELLADEAALAAAMKRLDPLPYDTAEVMAMAEATQRVRDMVVPLIPVGVNTPHTAERVFTLVEGSPLNLTGLVASPDIQAKVLEVGRTPGAKMPPPSALEAWVEAKTGDASLAFVIARAIGRNGTRAHFMWRRASEAAGPIIRDIFSRAIGGLL